MTDPIDRREFVKSTAVTSLGVMAGTMGAPAILRAASPNETVRVAVAGVNGRGVVLAQNFARLPNSTVAHIVDVDDRVVEKGLKGAASQASAPKVLRDIRRAIDDKGVDAIAIATPDHWHAPMALLAMQAGKHVYLEKPSGHNPREDELLIAATKRHRVQVQLGTQRRSGPHLIEAAEALRGGIIGTAHLARTWYANTRGTIGKGKVAAVPSTLDWELWQGPAPRAPFRDNVVHYNWHWFERWGTGEICNNGTHEIDVARWMLGVDLPTSVTSTGTRHHFADDWEFPDTQEATFEFPGGKTIVWHGQSCNGLRMYGRSRGTLVLGTSGSMLVDQDGYTIYDLKNVVVKEVKASNEADALNTVGDDALTVRHMRNFLDAIRTGTKLNAPISDGAKTGLVCHLGTIAQQTGRKLRIDPKTGRILGDPAAMKRWSRPYAPGWALSV